MRRYSVLFILLSFTLAILRAQTSEVLDSYGLPHPSQAKAMRFWLDDSVEGVQQAIEPDGDYQLDVSSLQDGLHILHCQVVDDNDHLTPIRSSFFVKITPVNGSGPVIGKKLIYWFDDEATTSYASIEKGGQLLDASSLTEGLHTFHYQVLCNNGQMTPVMSAMFLNLNLNSNTTTAQSFQYWFDDDVSTLKQSNVFGSVQKIDAAFLSAGLHSINFQLIDNEGKVGTPLTRMFFKSIEKQVPDSCNGITKYRYWVNDNLASIKTVTLKDTVKSYTLIDLLPVSKEAIQSSMFHFEVSDDTPIIYAKNVFRIRFHDAQGYFIDEDKTYIDYNVSQSVDDVTLIESGVSAIAEKPAANAIKWYKLDAERGDSLQFKLDRAATIQLFSPTGKEVYHVYGAESVKWGGLHAAETGTFYLALHDVTATYGNTLSIDYNHIDKYAVLRQDVNVVGNGGCSTITFEGNGFRDLYAVDLFTELGDTIKHVYIGHESDATTSVVFDFNGVALGKYSALFHFAQEDKVFANLVTVEEARDIELATTVTYPSVFRRGTSTTYTIEITNKGNMTAYYVPLEVKLIIKSIKDISDIRFDGYIKSNRLSDVLMSDSLEEETISIIREAEEKVNDISQFVFYKDSIIDVDYGISQLILSIPPNSTKQFTISIMCESTVYLEAYMTSEWFPLTECEVATHSLRLAPRASKRDWMCCQRERFECAADAVASIVGAFMPPGAGCATSLAVTGLETAYDVWCSDGNNNSERWNNYLKSQGQSLAKRLIQSAISCITAYFRLQKKKLMDDRNLAARLGNTSEVNRITTELQAVRTMEYSIIRDIYDGICTSLLGADCVIAFTKTKPNCPPNPDGGGGSSSPVKSFDPNEIYGYLAKSGSNAVNAEKTDVYYTIQFENDTTFATASAHEIVVTDTLDATKFDLSTFTPTRVKIGDKSAELTGEKNFVTTIDMRPEIYAIAQVTGTFDEQKGIAKWHITSLDPMTMEPTDDVIQGILPVNTNGQGIGEVSYDISLKSGLAHGTEVNNRAGIVFDTNETIMTPTWTNIVDRIAPVSSVKSITVLNDSTAAVAIDAFDNLSGCWRYDVYVQYGEGSAWWKAAENVRIDTTASVKIYEGIVHGFYVVATDSAGNVERKEAAHEYTLNLGTTTTVTAPDAGTNNATVYDLQGRKQDGNMKKKEIYVVTDNEKKKAHKVVGN